MLIAFAAIAPIDVDRVRRDRADRDAQQRRVVDDVWHGVLQLRGRDPVAVIARNRHQHRARHLQHDAG